MLTSKVDQHNQLEDAIKQAVGTVKDEKKETIMDIVIK